MPGKLQTAQRLAKTYSPTRMMGALRRRKTDWWRKLQYRPAETKKLANAVLFESFQGKMIGDNPLPIFLELQRQRPDLAFYWTIRRGETKAPPGAKALVHGSREWLKILATAKYLVNNTNFPGYFRKVPGQIYLQTWHGTPLKRLANDILDNKLTKSYLNTMAREASYWDFLVSPSPYCSAIFPSAFGYRGRILETGYPRNDRLVTANRSERQRIRSSLGVSDENQKLVLYAPTWRDFKRSPTGKWESVNFLEPNLALPDGFQLLFRGHTNTHDSHNPSVAGSAIDVTMYPDVTDLYLAADLLITDYSSVMFDFSVTGKPMIFLAPDLERYREERGFYFDYEAEVPGPIVTTTAEVLEKLVKLDDLEAEYSTRYQAWRQKFNSLEDGGAAARVIQEVFGA